MKLLIGIVLCVLVFANSGCATTSTIETETSSLKIFRLAQDAYADTNYELARDYYLSIVDSESYAKRHVVSARYELAFIAYKTGDLQQSYDAFSALIAEYYIDSSDFPQWILILSEKMVANIGEQLATVATQTQ